MTNEEVFNTIKDMFNSPTYSGQMRAGKKLKNNNVEIRDLNTKLIIYNNGNRIIVPTIGKGSDRKYLFNKHRIANDWRRF